MLVCLLFLQISINTFDHLVKMRNAQTISTLLMEYR